MKRLSLFLVLIVLISIVVARQHGQALKKGKGEKVKHSAVHSTHTTSADDERFSFAIAGSAFLIFYYFGAMQGLLDLGLIHHDTKFGGISGGSITSVSMVLKTPPESSYQAFKAIVQQCINGGLSPPCYQQLYFSLQEILQETLPSDAYKKVSHRVRMALSAIDPNSPILNKVAGWTVDKFESNEELRRALGGTSFLMCNVAEAPYTNFRGVPVVDGAYANYLTNICPGNSLDDGTCVRFQVYYPGRYTKDNIANDNPGGRQPSLPFSASINEAPFKVTKKKQSNPLAQIGNLPGPEICNSNFSVVEPYFQSPGLADIYPGQYPENPINMTYTEWQALAAFPTMEALPYQAELGYKDVILWAYKRGISGAAALLNNKLNWS